MKVGDKVKFIKSTYRGEGRTAGCFGFITDIEEGYQGNLYSIQPEKHHDEGDLWVYFENELELVDK